MSEAEKDAMEVSEELRKALAVKNLEVAEKDTEIARLQKRCALLDSLLCELHPASLLRRYRGFADLAVEARKAVTP